jgi:hypothetical protein
VPLKAFPDGTALVGYECAPDTLKLWFEGAKEAGLPPLEFRLIESAP